MGGTAGSGSMLKNNCKKVFFNSKNIENTIVTRSDLGLQRINELRLRRPKRKRHH
jgi:hypothetical protein